MAKKLFLGVDGGQTSTLAALCDEMGNLLGTGRAGPSNHIHEPGGMARMENALSQSISKAFAQAGWEGTGLPEVEAVCCGMTGGIDVVPDLIRRLVQPEKLIIEYDLVTAHAGALCGKPGVVVIAGTGSVAYGVDSRGFSVRAGGWAYIMGDEGSAYDLGRKALIAAARMEDGRGPTTCLHDAILAHFHCNTLWDVRTLLYSGEIDRREIAQLSRLVVQADRENDPVAGEIFRRGVDELCTMTRAVISRLQLGREEILVATVGGLFRAGVSILEPFSNELQKSYPQVKIIAPYYQPVMGAILLAMKAAGISISTEVETRLWQSDKKLGEKEGDF